MKQAIVKSPSSIFGPISIINVVLLVLCVGALAYYVSASNAVASQEYQTLSLRNQVSHLIDEQSTLAAEKTATENPVTAQQFAESKNMVEAKDIMYVFENGKVALER